MGNTDTTKSPKIRRFKLILGEDGTEELQIQSSQSFISQLETLQSSEKERGCKKSVGVYGTIKNRFPLSFLEFCIYVMWCFITSGIVALLVIAYLKGEI